MFLAWFDADRKKPVATKIAEAHARYVEKFGKQPLVCLINPDDLITDAKIELRPLPSIGRNCFWIGADDVIEEPASPEPVAPTLATEPKRRRSKKAVLASTQAATPAIQVTSTAAQTLEKVRAEPAATPKRQRRTPPKSQPDPVVPSPTKISGKRRARRDRSAA